jgi:uncharacterized protein (DUF362 family)
MLVTRPEAGALCYNNGAEAVSEHGKEAGTMFGRASRLLLTIILAITICAGAGCAAAGHKETTTATAATSGSTASTAAPSTTQATAATTTTATAATTATTATSGTAAEATTGTTTGTSPAPGPAIVGLARGKDYAAVTALAITCAGGLGDVVSAGDTVLIKPNLCWNNYVDSPITTDYRVVAEIVTEVKALGAGRIIIAEGPFGPECFTRTNLAASKFNPIEGVEFFSFNSCSKNDCYYLKGKPSVTGKALYIPKIYVDADVVITVPKMKTHNAGMVTLGLKNAFGVPPRSIYGTSGAAKGAKVLLHQNYDFSEAIVEINLIRKPDFTVIDGIVAGEGNGPLQNTPVDAQIILAGRDVVAVDTVGAFFMGFNPAKIPHLALASKVSLGQGDLDKIKVIGGNVFDMVIDFKSIFPKD